MAFVTRELPYPLVGERARVDAPGPDGCSAIARVSDGAAAGRVCLEERDGALFIRVLEIEPALRGFGLGSDAARLVRDAAAAAGWPMLRAWGPPDLGLATYYWSRMGLRPRHGPGPDGGIWFERELAG
ncbi:MAG: hypothetical protein IT303_16565 [Dehalococcoidia bacterium]|nr:hypothetical protein [Dehalococcoidia bacterium]